jgi:hypothetical protein
MSTNYYLRTPDTPPDNEGIHLGQFAAGGFTFRAYPDRNVTTYDAWLAQLDTGTIYAESGYTVTREEMVEIASAAGSKAKAWAQCGSTFAGGAGFYDEDGRRWLAVEFC